MVLEPVHCPYCHSTDVIKHGRLASGKQRYRCRNSECARSTFIGKYTKVGYQPKTKAKIIDMALNGSGIRDTARVLGISPSTVIDELKKRVRVGSGESTPS